MSLESNQPQENVNTSPQTDKVAGADTLVSIPDGKEEEAVTKTKELQPEREATFKDYLVRPQHDNKKKAHLN
jgi:hypothetical protein